MGIQQQDRGRVFRSFVQFFCRTLSLSDSLVVSHWFKQWYLLWKNVTFYTHLAMWVCRKGSVSPPPNSRGPFPHLLRQRARARAMVVKNRLFLGCVDKRNGCAVYTPNVVDRKCSLLSTQPRNRRFLACMVPLRAPRVRAFCTRPLLVSPFLDGEDLACIALHSANTPCLLLFL
jgi:hypothetical protein